MHEIEDKYLLGASGPTIKSLNGTRVADSLLRNVPEPATFKIALRMMKYWIKNRGLYGNKLGYLGGVQTAILTARICQLYPCASASTIVIKLFKILLLFVQLGKWGPDQPIKLVDEGSQRKGTSEWKQLDDDIWQAPGLSTCLVGHSSDAT